MMRREFITLLGVAAAWPLAAGAQQPDKKRRVGVLLPAVADDAVYQTRMAAFLQELALSGWIVGRNLSIDIRWATTNVSEVRKHATAGIDENTLARRRTLARPGRSSGGPRVGPSPTPLGTLARGYPSRIKLGVPKIYKIQKSRSPSAASSWSGTRQVSYSITKHAMRRSADEICATSISFRPKVFSDQHQLLTEFFPPIEFCTTRNQPRSRRLRACTCSPSRE